MYQHFRARCDLADCAPVALANQVRCRRKNGALTMTPITSKFSRRHSIAAVMLVALASISTAQAGSCPADKMRPDGSGEKMNGTPAKAVTDSVLASVDLA